MAFIIEDPTEQSEEVGMSQQNQPLTPEQIQETSQEQQGVLKSAAKLFTVPASRLIENFSSVPGNLIEMGPSLIKAGYGIAGKEAPEALQHPASGRLNPEGEPYELLKTSQERREDTKRMYSEYTEPTTGVEHFLSDMSDIVSGFLTGGLFNKKALAAGAGAAYTYRKGAEAIGMRPEIEALTEPVVSGLGVAAAHPQEPSKFATDKGSELTRIAKTEGIEAAPAAIQAAGKRASSAFLRAVGKAGEREKEQAVTFSQQIENAYHTVLSTIFQPYENEHNIRTLRDGMGQLFKPVTDLAKKRPGNINKNNFLRVINEEIDDIKRSKSLTDQQKASLKILEDTKNNIGKRFTLDNAEATYRSYNQHIDNWDSPTRGDIRLINAKKALKDDMMKAGEDVPGFNEKFNLANAAYTELSNLDKTTSIIKGAFDSEGQFNVDKFHKIVLNKDTAQELIKTMGPDRYERLRGIAELSKEAAKNFKAVGAMMSDETNALNKAIGSAGGLTQLTSSVSTYLGRGLLSRILLDPNLERNYLGYLKSLKEKSPRVAAYYLNQLNKQLKEEEEQPKEQSKKGFILED